MSLDDHVSIAAVPMPLRWLVEPESWSVPDGASLQLGAGARTDWFVDPQRSAEPTLNAPALVGDPSGDYLLSARVTVPFEGPRRGRADAARERAQLGQALLRVLA